MTEHSTVGALLRARRLELGMSLEEVAGRTRVRRTYLTALENDRFDVIPGEAYVAGFLRIYAEDLGLPVAPLLARCREQVTAGEAGSEKMVVSGTRSRARGRRRSGWAVSVTAAALVGAALVLAHLNAGETKKADFFAPRSGPTAFPAVLWTVLMAEPEAEGPFSLSVLTLPDEGFAPVPEPAASLAPSSPPPVRRSGRPRQAESRPAGVFLGWSADHPDPPPVIRAGPELLVLNREGAPIGAGGADDH